MIKIIFLTLILCCNLFSAAQANFWDHEQYAKTKTLIAKYEDSQALLGVEFTLEPGWKIYNDQESEVGFPTTVTLENSQNIAEYKLFYPPATQFTEIGGFISYGYKDKIILPLKITAQDPAADLSAKMVINYALCKEVCIPVKKELIISIAAGSKNKENYKAIQKYLEPQQQAIWWIIISAFLAGLILNLMPCVLPVLLLKIVNFLEKRKAAPREIIIASIATILGVMSTFIASAFIVITLKAIGYNVGWGIHFQEPLFLGFLCILLVIFACSSFDYFTINLPNFITAKINKLEKFDSNFLKHFFSGIIVTLLATPCSAPFLGTAMAFAITGSNIDVFLVFISLGLGLALPYILLIFFPSLLQHLPKPGKWMQALKKLMGMFLIATACWLIFVLDKQIGFFGAGFFTLQLIAIFAAYKFRTHLQNLVGANKFILVVTANIIIGLLAIHIFKTAHDFANMAKEQDSDYYLDYKNTNIAELVAQDKVVFVNITAEWCLTCKFNEFTVLNTAKIKNYFANNKAVLPVKADFTNRDQEISDLLKSVNRHAIPTYIIYSKNHPKGVVLGEFLQADKLIKLLENEKLSLEQN